jgi:hypothetical protein
MWVPFRSVLSTEKSRHISYKEQLRIEIVAYSRGLLTRAHFVESAPPHARRQ